MNAKVDSRAGFVAAQVIGEPRRAGDWIWLLLVFIVAPLLTVLWVPPAGWIPALWVVSLLASRAAQGLTPGVNALAYPDAARPIGAEVVRIVARFAVAATLLIVIVATVEPPRLFDWPLHRRALWLAVITLYPLLSVVPQELLYRRMLFARIRAMGGSERCAAVSSALAFSAMHLVYLSPCAVVLTLIGGCFFADTYRRTGLLWLVCLEHALYGNLIFTVGLGDCFSYLPSAGWAL